MDPITKARCPTCPIGPIDPYESFQPEIAATLVTLEAKNMPLNPPQKWGFQAKNDPLMRLFSTIEQLSGLSLPNLDFGYAPQVLLSNPNHFNQKLQSLW